MTGAMGYTFTPAKHPQNDQSGTKLTYMYRRARSDQMEPKQRSEALWLVRSIERITTFARDGCICWIAHIEPDVGSTHLSFTKSKDDSTSPLQLSDPLSTQTDSSTCSYISGGRTSQEKITRTGHRGTQTSKPRHNSLGPFGHTTFGSGGEGADLSPAARSGGMRRRPRAQAALLEHVARRPV